MNLDVDYQKELEARIDFYKNRKGEYPLNKKDYIIILIIIIVCLICLIGGAFI